MPSAAEAAERTPLVAGGVSVGGQQNRRRSSTTKSRRHYLYSVDEVGGGITSNNNGKSTATSRDDDGKSASFDADKETGGGRSRSTRKGRPGGGGDSFGANSRSSSQSFSFRYLMMLPFSGTFSSSSNWFPSKYEDDDDDDDDDYSDDNDDYGDSGYSRSRSSGLMINHHNRSRTKRSWKRRIFLLLTEPNTSILSAIFFTILVLSITAMNAVMIAQTMTVFQFTPIDCRACGGDVSYLFDDDGTVVTEEGIECVCPPTPEDWTGTFLSWCIYFFTVEWSLRVLTYEPSSADEHVGGGRRRRRNHSGGCFGAVCRWFCELLGFLFSTTTVLDALAIFPYYVEMDFGTNGLMSLRLLRLFRVFQLVRLGQYNDTFISLTTVLFQSTLYLKFFVGLLTFGATIFGSLLYWLEKGDWKYYEPTSSYQFVRYNEETQVEEISPFTSIPACFWWFFVTATTVGYGDTVPVTTFGKFVGILTMLTGVVSLPPRIQYL